MNSLFLQISETLDQSASQIGLWTGLTSAQVSQIFLGIIGITVVLLVVSAYRKTRKLNQKLERLQHELHIANSSAIGMGQQLLALEKKILKQNQVNNNVHQHQRVLEQQARKLEEQHDNVAVMTPRNNVTDNHFPESHSPEKNNTASMVEDNQPTHKQTHKKTTASSTHAEIVEDLDDNTQAYQQAKQWLAQGYDVAYVVKKSGLSQAEVSLMHALQKRAASSDLG